VESFFEEFGEQEERGPGVEAVVVEVEEGTASSCEGVLFEDCD
jgi:hypothetical protein